ncbi:Trimethylguanosine synthase [Fasciolopsis buskii]|uniref:Trimethylguanosine synthase n=1 Tax=Fasciolopsis buskii TaxID=27845 RepID=A0A8E0RRY2_9TREM|nr:Trimethylguanosine synthase [Fasciolopsis buski]
MPILDTLSDVSSDDSNNSVFVTKPAESHISDPPPCESSAQIALSESCSEKVVKRVKLKRKRKQKTDPPYKDPQLLKYWNRRYDLFERFDSGIKLDRDSWFGVTPECIARRQAQVCACDLIIDAYAGVGGNSIQFANTCGLVLAIENNWSRIQLLKHNSNVYGLSSRIMPVCGDVENLLRSLRSVALQTPTTNDKGSGGMDAETTPSNSEVVSSTAANAEPIFPVVFMSPPWGGPGYTGVVLPPGSSSWNTRKRRKWFATSEDAVEPTKNLEDLCGFQDAVDAAKHMGCRMLLYLPRSASVGQMLCLGWPSKVCSCAVCRVQNPVVIEEYSVRGRRVAVGVYVGDFPLEVE